MQRDDAAALIAAGNTAVANPAQVWGSPEVADEIKLWVNFGIPLANNKELYAHANYVSKTVTGGFYFRNPNNRGAVYSADSGATLLVGDLLDGSGNCPTVTVTNNAPDPAALARSSLIRTASSSRRSSPAASRRASVVTSVTTRVQPVRVRPTADGLGRQCQLVAMKSISSSATP